MCTNLTVTTSVSGSGLGQDGWFDLDQAVVYFDHPQDALVDHALCIDVRGPTSVSDASARVAIELDAPSARRLARTILATLDRDEVQAILAPQPADVAPSVTSGNPR
jgi:hypothetical protein